MHRPETLRSILCITLSALAGVAQDAPDPYLEVRGTWGYGAVLRPAGDLDGDGWADLLLGSPNDIDPSDPAAFQGSVEARSGRSGQSLWKVYGQGFRWQLGCDLAVVSDLDGDGVRDVVAGAWQAGPGVGADFDGAVYVYSGATGAQRLMLTSNSAQRYASGFGFSVADAGDVDGDGRGDFVVGVPQGPNGNGMAVVFTSSGAIWRHLFGGAADGAQDQFGYSMASAGDVDGNGDFDVVVGAPGDTLLGAVRYGAVHVFDPGSGQCLQTLRGAPNSALRSALGRVVGAVGDVDQDGRDDILTSHLVTGGTSGTSFDVWSVLDRRRITTGNYAHSVAALGDIDGDGVDDFMVGERPVGNGSAGTGLVRVYVGRAAGVPELRYEFRGTGGMAGGVGSAADLNGDGFGDFAMQHANGAVRLFLGRPLPVLRRSFVGLAAGDRFGFALDGVGDLDGDRVPDVVVGSPGVDGVGGADLGAVTVLSGADGRQIHQWFGDTPGDGLGDSVHGAGHLDHDGVPDVLSATWSADSGLDSDVGLVRAWSGASGAELWSRFGSAAVRYTCAAPVGDVDGDGFEDVLVGAPEADTSGGAAAGLARLLSGRDGSQLREYSGMQPGARFGRSVAGGGDVDGDEIPDLIIGAPFENTPAGVDSGAVHLVSGADGSTLGVLYGSVANELIGLTVADAGDVDRDGFSDIVVGSYRSNPSTSSFAGNFRVHSGATRAVLFEAVGELGEQMGIRVASADDVNGDGHADVLVGSRRSLRVFSGREGGALIERLRGDDVDLYGWSVAGVGDIDGDGLDEVGLGAHLADVAGALDVGRIEIHGLDYDDAGVVRPGRVRTFGAGCPGAGGRQPRIGTTVIGPRVGEPLRLTSSGGPASPSTAHLLLGYEAPLDLGVIGLVGCTRWIEPLDALITSTRAGGRASMALPIPNSPILLGAELGCQWVVFDPAAPRALPLAFSDALEVRFGR